MRMCHWCGRTVLEESGDRNICLDCEMESPEEQRRRRTGRLRELLQAPVSVKIVLGQATVTVADALGLTQRCIKRLDSIVGEAMLKLGWNGKVVAQGPLTVTDEEAREIGIHFNIVAPADWLPAWASEEELRGIMMARRVT